MPHDLTDSPTVLTLRHAQGLELTLMDQGATWLGCKVPMPDGTAREVLLGRASAREPHAMGAFLGATIGRYANRIGQAQVRHEGETIQLTRDAGSQHQLHGGPQGFDKKRWTIASHDDSEAVFTLVSPDGDQGYPGQLDVRVSYRLLDGLVIEMQAEARSSAPTPVCLTNHAYFNLDAVHGDARQQTLRIGAQKYLPVDGELIPLGELASVEGTGFDFRAPKTLAQDWMRDEQQRPGAGYDHAFLLDGECAGMQQPAVFLQSADGSLAMELFTTLPSVQMYGGQFLKGTPSRDGTPYPACAGIALEPQFLPDSPNHPEWPEPSCWLMPGDVYRQTIRWRFTPRVA
jgi:aldose 1-epimerase